MIGLPPANSTSVFQKKPHIAAQNRPVFTTGAVTAASNVAAKFRH